MSAGPALPVDPSPEELERYLVRSRLEVGQVLRAMARAGEVLTAHPDGSPDYAPTVVLDVDGGQGTAWLDMPGDPALAERLTAARQILLVGFHDGVKVQFTVQGAREARRGEKAVLRVELPPALLKIQRREYYRLPTPVARPLTCVMPTPRDGPCAVQVADLSIGGLALRHVPARLETRPGARYPGCRLALPDVGVVEATMEITHTVDVPLANGQSSRQCGVRFLDISPAAEAMLQRYIMRLDRERNSRRRP